MFKVGDIKLVLDVCGKQQWIYAQQCTPFKKLVKHIAHDFKLQVKDMQIINANVMLDNKCRKSVKQLGLEDFTVLTIVVAVRNTCTVPKRSDHDKVRVAFKDIYFETAPSRLKPCERKRSDGVKECVTLTTQQDIVSLDDSEEFRAKMPCGHVIGSETMESYVASEISTDKHNIVCPVPGCNTQWSWQLVSHVSLMAMHERIEIQTNLARSFLLRKCDAKICPKCNVYMIRKGKDDKITCTTCCVQDKTSNDMLCWNCLSICTKYLDCEQCHGAQDPRAAYIQEGGYITFGYFNADIPRVRACPGCGILIHYIDGCKHMTCIKCHTQFCFQCLQDWGQGLLVSHRDCKTAPMQDKKSLPYHRQVVEDIALTTRTETKGLATHRNRSTAFSDLSENNSEVLY